MVQEVKGMEQLHHVELEEEGFCFPNIRKMRGWKSFFGLIFGGLILFGSPAFYLMLINKDNILSLKTDANIAIITSVEPQVVRWSCWITFVWILYVLLWFFVSLLPGIIIYLLTFIAGHYTEALKEKIDYITELRSNIVWVAWQVLASISYSIFFIQMPQVPLWQTCFGILASGTVFAIAFLIQRFFVQNIALNFHRVSYNDRIVRTKKAILILQKLRRSLGSKGLLDIVDNFDRRDDRKEESEVTAVQPKSGWFPWTKKSSPAPSVIQTQTEIDLDTDDLTSIYSAEIDSTPAMATLRRKNTQRSTASRKPPTKSSSLPTLFGQISDSRLNIGRIVQDITEWNTDHYALSLGEELFNALSRRRAVELTVADFTPYFATEETTKQVFALFDRDENGSVSRDEFIATVVGIYKEKRDLSHSLGDLSQALGNLNQILSAFSILGGCIFSLPLWGSSVQAILPFTSILLAMSFIFGGSAKTTFDCIVFLFVVHPYDAGDRIIFDGNPYVVVELNLLTTTLTIDGKKIYIPNEVMSKKTIVNARRSGDMSESVDIQIDFYVEKETVVALQEKMNNFCAQNPKSYLPKCSLDIVEIGLNDMVTYRLGIPHKGNWQDGARRLANKTAFLFELKKSAIELGIKFHLPTQPTIVKQ